MADDIQSNIRINVDTASAMDSIRLLQNQISAFHTQMSKMGAAQAADARNLQQNLVNSINSTGAFTANMTKVKTTAEQFTASLERNKLSMGEYFRYAGGATKTFGRLFQSEFETINKVARERVKDLQSQYIKLGRDANGAMQAIRVRPLVLDMENLGTKTQIAAQRQQLLNQLLKQGSTNLLNFGKNTQWAGRQLMVGFTIPLSIMGAAAMKSYKEIEEAGIRLRRVYGDFSTTNVETEKMVKDIQKLALEYTKYGVAVKDSMQMAADAAAMGKKGADLLAQVSSSARLAVLGGVDQQMALKTTTSLTDAFGVSTRQLAKDINFLNAVENQTTLSIEDMTIAIPKAAPVIQQLGGDVKDLAFFLTAMKEGGINASESANALKSGLASLINPTNTASKMLQGFGINLREIVQGNKGDVKKTVVDFAQALDKLDPLNRAKAIEQLFGKFQFARMSTLFKNVIEQGSQASQVLKLASASSLELSMLAQRELNKIESSPLYKFQKSIADFQAALAPVGEQFMKALTPIISFGTDVLNNFNNLGEGVKGFIVKFVAVAGVVGPVLLMSFGLIANAVANVIKGFALMKDIFNKTGKSSLSLGEQVSYMTSEQIQAAAIASSLDQVHSKLKQTFTSEAAAVDMLTAAYRRSVAAQSAFAVPITPRGPIRRLASGGFVSGPGTGTSDSIPAMLSNGEAVIPAKSVSQNKDLVQSLINDSLPRFAAGGIIGGPSKSLMQQVNGTSAVIAYGAHQPFTTAHQGIAQMGMSMAEQSGMPFFQFTSNQGKAKRSVLSDDLKSRMISEAIGRNPEFAKNPFDLMAILSKAGIKDVNILLGEDRMKSPVWEAAAKEFGITITKTGIPRPAGSTSGTMTRAAAASGNFGMFESLLASGVSKSTKDEIFKNLFAAGNSKIRKFSNGGMISGPGSGTSDSILARVSNGEAIIPAKSVARNPGMVRQLISGNIPGFARGVSFDDPYNLSEEMGLKKGEVFGKSGYDPLNAQIHAVNAVDAGHIAESATRTAEEILTNLISSMTELGATAKQVESATRATTRHFETQAQFLREQGMSEQEITDYRYQTYSENVIAQPSFLNNKGSGQFSQSEMQTMKAFYKPGAEGATAFANLSPHLKALGLSEQETSQVLIKMADNLNAALSKVEDTAQFNLDDLSRLATEAQDQAVADNQKAKIALEKIRSAEFTTRSLTSHSRPTLGPMSYHYKGVAQERLDDAVSVLGLTSSPYAPGGKPTMKSSVFEEANSPYNPRTMKIAMEQIRKTGAEGVAIVDNMIRQYGQLGARFVPEMVATVDRILGPELMAKIETTVARNVGTISTSMATGVEKGFNAAVQRNSPPKQLTQAGHDSGRALVAGARSQIDDAAVAGKAIGATITQNAMGGTRVSSGGIITPAETQAQKVQRERGTRVIAMNGFDPVTGMYNTSSLPPGFTPAPGMSDKPLGPKNPGRYGLFLNNLGSKVGNMDPDKFQGRMFGGSMAAGMASMILPGPLGQIAGTASMLMGVGGMFKNLGPVVGKLIPVFGKLIPFVGIAVTAFEAFDKIVLPLIRKNADSFNALADTLNITKDKIKSINDFFGTEGQLSGVRAQVVATGTQTGEQASIAKQFQQSEQFKSIYEESANKMQSLSKQEFERAMQGMAIDLAGQGYDPEAVKAIIDAIAIQAKQSSVSIVPELFSLENPETRSLMNKNVKSIFTDASKNIKDLAGQNFGDFNANDVQRTAKGDYDNFFGERPMFSDPETVSKLKANVSELSSYMSALSGQFANGEISVKEYNLQYKELISLAQQQPGTSGIDALRAAFVLLNAEIGGALSKLNDIQFAAVSDAILAGVTSTKESLDAIYYGTEEQKQEQTQNYIEAAKTLKINRDKKTELQKQITGLQNSSGDIAKTEQSINDKYDKRIAQIEKIKKLNEQIAKSQQGQLTLAEALNRGDIAAAARAAIDIQNNDIQTSLENQQDGLNEARKAELAPLKDGQEANTAAIKNLTTKIEKLNTDGITVKNVEDAGPVLQSKQGNDPMGYLGYVGNAASDLGAAGLAKNIFEFFQNPVRFLLNKGKQYLPPGTALDRDGNVIPQRPAAVKPYTGGHITGPGTGTSDSIPAMLSNGEYVIRANAVKTIGVDTLNKLNQADRLGFAAGGMARAYRKGGMVGCPCGTPGCPGCAMGYAMGGMVRKYKDGGEAKPPKKPRLTLEDIANTLSNPTIMGAAHGTDVIGGTDLANSYVDIFSGKGDFWDYLSGILAPFSFAGLGMSSKAGTIGTGLSKAFSPIKKGARDVSTFVAAKKFGMQTKNLPPLINPGKGTNPALAAAQAALPKMRIGKNNKLEMKAANSDYELSEMYDIESIHQIPADMLVGLQGSIRNTKVPLYKDSQVGSVSGTIFDTDDGLRAQDIFVKLEEAYRGKGIAQRFTTQFMELLKNVGVNHIDIDASLTDGGYAWARANFKFATKPKDLIQRMEAVKPFINDKKFDKVLESLKAENIKDLPMPKEVLGLKTNWRKYFSEQEIKDYMLGKYKETAGSSAALSLMPKVNFNTTSLGELIMRGSNWQGTKELGGNSKITQTFQDVVRSVSTGAKGIGTMRTNAINSIKALPKNIAGKFQKPEELPLNPMLFAMQGAQLPYGFSKAPTKAELDAVVAFVQNSPLAQIQRGDDLASIVAKSTIPQGTSMFRVPTIRQTEELLSKKVGDIVDIGNRFTSVAGQSELQAIGMTAAGKLNTGNRELAVNTILHFVAGEDLPGIMNHKFHSPNYLKSAFGDKSVEYPFQSEGLLPPGLKGKIVGISQSGNQKVLKVLLSKFANGGMVGKYANGGMVMPIPEPAPRQFANGGMVRAATGGMLINGKFLRGFAMGGMVQKFVDGGYAMGTDTVPAMLTPGEFVIKKSAVDRIGPSALNKINGYAEGGLVGGMSAVAGDSVYNSNKYEINVNVSSNSNPDQIANAVMTKIRQIDNGRVRGLGR